MNWTVKSLLEWMTAKFKSVDFATPLLDAQILLAHVLNCEKIRLYSEFDKPIGDAERTILRELVRRRLLGEPVAYLIGKKYWHSLELFVDARVLIPRPETETLLDFVLHAVKTSKFEPKVIFDLCTGSGCLAIALAKQFPNVRVVGVDFSQDALDVCAINGKLNNAPQVQWERGDVTSDFVLEQLTSKYGTPDIVIANPPYVTEQEWQSLDFEVKDFEPKIALVADEDGLRIGKRIAAFAVQSRVPLFAMELAAGQPAALSNTAEVFDFLNFPRGTPGFFVAKDLEGKARYLCKVHLQRIAEEIPELDEQSILPDSTI